MGIDRKREERLQQIRAYRFNISREQRQAKQEQRAKQEQEQRDNAKNALEIASKAAVLAGTKTLEAQSKENAIQSLARKAAENQAFRNYNKDGFTMRENRNLLNDEDKKRISNDTVAKVQNNPAMRFASQKVAEQTAKRDLEKLGVDNKETEKKISEIYRKNAQTAFDLKAKQSVTKSTQDIKDMSVDELESFIPNSVEEAQAALNEVTDRERLTDKFIKENIDTNDWDEKAKEIHKAVLYNSEKGGVVPDEEKSYLDTEKRLEQLNKMSFADKLDRIMQDTADTATAVGSALVSGAAGLFTELVGYVGDGFDKVMEGISWAGDKLSNDLLGFNTDFFKKTKEFFEKTGSGEEWHKATEDMHNQAVANNMNLGMSREAAEILASLEEAVGQAIPQVAMAVATGGSSEALYAAKSMANAKRAMNLTNAAAKGSKLAMVGQSLKTIATDVSAQYKAWAKQPMFTTTLITELGSNYDDAVEQGADPKTALSWAAFVSLVNSAIEMHGGIEAGPSSVLKEALGEGAEEIYQGTVSGLMKVATVPDIPLVSIDGSNAAFNLKEMALSFVGGALGGATGGGIGKLIDFSANPITTAQKRKALGNAMKSDENTLAAYIDMGMKSGNEKVMSEATSIFNALDQGKLDSIASVTLGKFAQKTERAYQLAVINKIANAEKSDNSKANLKTAAEIYHTIGQIINNPEYYLSDTLATHIKHNPVAGEILTKSAGLQSRINEYTPVSTIREVARMVSSNISNGVRDNSNISIDQVGRPVNTNSPREIDEGAIKRVRDKTAKLDDYLSVTGKSLDSYLKDDGSYSADEIIAEANSVITELDRIKAANPVKASEPAAHDSIITGNASTGMDVVNPQNVVTVKDNSITLDNGVTVPVTDELLSQNDSRLSDTTKKLYSASAGYKDNVKAAFISGYNGVDVDTYIKQFQNVYDVFELTGKLSEDERYDAVKYIEQALGKEVFNVARKAGQQARHEREQARMRQNERQKANRENDKGKNKTSQRESETAKTGYALAKKYSIKYTTENKPVVVIEDNILDGVSKNDWVKTVKNVISEKFSGGIPISGRLIKVNAITRNEFSSSKNTRYYRGHNRQLYVDKFKSANNLDEIVLASTNYVNEDLKHNRKDNFKEFARGDVLIRVGSSDYTANVIIGLTTGNEMVLYDVISFKPATLNIKKVGTHTVQSLNVKNRRDAMPTNNTIPQNDTVVNSIIRKNYENSDTTQRKKGVTIKKYKTTIRNSSENGKIGAFTDGKTQADIIEKIAKEYNKRGINVEIIDEAGEQNGWYTPSNNTITVNLSAKNPLEAFLHETGHAIKAYAGEYWEEIKNAAFTYIAQIEDESISELRKGYAELFEAHSKSYTNEAIDEEIVSDAIAAMARDKNSVLKFYNALIQNGAEETLAQKIIRKLKEILMKLKAHFLDFDTIAVEYNSSVTRAVREGNTSKTPFFEYAGKISNILSQSFENLNVERNIKTLNIKFSQIDNKPFNVKVDEISKMTSEEVLDNARRGTFISVSEHTPKIILDNVSDAQDLKMIMSFSKLYLDMNKSGVLRGNYHNLGAEEIKKLYDYISNPQAIVKMDNGRLNLFSTLSEGNNNVISIELNTVKDINDHYQKYNLIVTVFNSKDNYIRNLINKHGVSVEYIKKDLPQVNSQLYKWLTIINDKSTNNTISQNDTVVNSNISENSENDTKKFSLKEPIEETKNLIAVHNLNIENLEKSLELGGLPMPSIAITKDKLGHVEFGKVSLVFGKDTIDPQINSANKIYSGDAYTPTFPSVEYKLSDSKLKEVADYFNMSQSYLEGNINASDIDYTVETLSNIHEIREQYLRDNNITLSEEEKDAYFSRYLNAISGKNNFQKFKNYIRDKIKPIFIKRGIYNGSDTFTPSGNRKSFEALHYEYTLENLVKAMRRGEQTGEGLVNISSFSGAVTKQYNSIRELHKNENRIVKMSDYERKKLIKSYQYKLSSIIDSMIGDRNSILYYDNAGEVIIESIRNGLSLNSIGKILSKYKDVYNITDQTAKDIKSLAEDVQNLPTKYFESKPQRAVYFSEVKKALLPQDASDKIIQDLYDVGVEKVIKYSDDIDRLNKLNSFDDVKFSLKQDIDNKYGSLYNEEKPLTVSKQTFRRIEAAMNERLARAFSEGEVLPSYDKICLSDAVYKIKINEYGNYTILEKYDSLEDYERKRGLKNDISNYRNGTQDNRDIEGNRSARRYNTSNNANINNGKTAGRNVEADRRTSIRKSDESGGNRDGGKSIGDSDPFRKYSLLEDIDIRLAKKAYQRNKKLQVDTQVVKDLFEKAGRVLDKSTVDAVADKIAKRYYFGGDAKMKQLLRDKLYAFYTYVSREDAVDAQIALYGYEVSKDIVAMSKEVSGFTDGENVYEEYGESIYDVIAADLINEYANTAIVQAPQRLQEEHEKIAERYRKAEPDSEEKKSLYRELKASRDELVAARERYVRSREEVKKLDTLLRRTQSYYKRKLDSKKAKSLAYSLRPEQKRIRNKEIMKLVDKYGAYPQNEYSKVDAYVPKRDSRGLAVSRVPKTIIESDFADENTINTINDAILDGALSHEIKSNKSAQEYAESIIAEGFDKAYFEFKKEIEKIKTFADDTPNKVALAKELIEEAQRRGDQDTVRDIVTDLAIYGLLGGRTTQAFNMLRATGSAGQALYLEKWVQRRNDELYSKWRDKRSTWAKEDNPLVPRNVQGYKTGYNEFKPLVLNRELMQRLVNATDEEEITELSTKIMADLALQENSTLADKIQAWRYMSMLTNPTTHIRNLVGNGIFAILREGQNTVRAGLEKALNKASGGKIKLTTVVKIKDEYKRFAKEDWKKSNSLVRKSGKYNIDDFIMQEKKIFKSKVGKPIEKVRKFNSWALEAEDGIFIKYAYTRALGRYLQAQKISLEENPDPKLEQERQSRIEEARAYALEESLIATYRNANAVATALTQLANKNAAFDILVNSVMPFKKTPANIFVQSMKYSPIGIGLGIKQIVFDGIKHQKTANQIIDTFASGITGTGVFLLGLLLRRLGILQGMFDDDDGDDQIDKMKKIQENSINLFGQSFTIDWSAPAIVPLMMGAEFSDGIGNFEFDGSLTDNIWQIVSRSVDPLINMTMLEGLNDMLTSIKYSENNSIGELGFRAISNYASQFIPTVGGKIARTLDGTSRMTYIDPGDNDFLSRNIQNVQKKSPFWYSDLQPVVDEWGREGKEGNVITRILENFISPGYWETIDSDYATDVIEDLYDELQDKSLLPKKPEKSFTMYVKHFDGEKYESVKDKENYKNGKREMSGDEYTTAALAQGQTQHDLIAELKENSVYESMNGAEKAAVIENIYKFAKYAGKYAVDDSYYGSEQEKWCRELNNNRASLTGILNEILNRSREK